MPASKAGIICSSAPWHPGVHQLPLSPLAALDQDNYPEHLGNMFILNAGYTFS